jgi:DNA-binding HxlR family transcriptional regulator
MKKISFAEMRCSLARTLDVIGDWWTPLIVRDIFIGVTKFDELVEDLGISRNLLTRRLRHLVDAGVLQRRAYQQRPVRYSYALTEAGRDLVPAILALTAWGDRWARPPEGRPMLMEHKTCGHHCDPVIACSHCRDALAADDVKILPGPGGAALPGTVVVARKLVAGAS